MIIRGIYGVGTLRFSIIMPALRESVREITFRLACQAYSFWGTQQNLKERLPPGGARSVVSNWMGRTIAGKAHASFNVWFRRAARC
jgi:hypothetical protein